MTRQGMAARAAAIFLLVLPAACGGSGDSSDSSSITLYTCVSDTTIQPVVAAFEKANPDTEVDVYRAPTGDLNARVAGDVRSRGLQADVIWACDPLTMQNYVDQDLVGGWTPTTDIAPTYATDDYVGVAVLYVVAVTQDGITPPATWSDLTGDAYADGVALPDPAVAASALGALGYFAGSPDYGTDFYATLVEHGATQVSTPDDVVAGVAEGRYAAGFTIANSAYAALEAGSPIEVSWPAPGAVGVYGPIALARDTSKDATAKTFISYVTSKPGQQVLADAGSYPTLDSVSGPTKPDDAAVVFPDWSRLADSQDDLMTAYQKLIGAE